MGGDVWELSLDKIYKCVDGIRVDSCTFVAMGVEDSGADIAWECVYLGGWWWSGMILGGYWLGV